MPVERTHARLCGAEAHHLAHVMRAKPGDAVTLFDGSGAEFAARVERVGRSEIELAVLARSEIDRELPTVVTLGVALPKGDRQRWLIEKAVELGVARLVPLETERSDRESPTSSERLRRAVIEASKQCGRNRLMEIAAPCKLANFLAEPIPSAASDEMRLFAHPAAPRWREVLAAHELGRPPRPVILAIGPEGGFTDTEVALAASRQWLAVGCGERILRVETAAIALAAAIMFHVE
jgi:16S rRNA (uracil1498-N3)-methyltransferase